MKKNGEDFEFLSGCLLSYDICSELYLFWRFIWLMHVGSAVRELKLSLLLKI
jgi:hypothetical protein